MSLIVRTNMALMNAQNQFKINTKTKASSAEKLSSGYRINRAADDAAGLTISEKMRQMIRGLKMGTNNTEDGISWVQTGDGALEEVHTMMHRMKELTVQALNDTNTPADRAALQAEFNELQSEIDRITGTTLFNTQHIFEEHQPTFHEYEGNVIWGQGQPHMIANGANDLNITYQKDAASPVETLTLTVKPGLYTTQELTDEIDSFLTEHNISDIVLEYTDKGSFNLALEGGEQIDSVTGGLSYLLYDVFTGGSVGSLVGTTIFPDEFSELLISNENNNMTFSIEDFDGNITHKSITIPNGSYNKQQIMDILNDKLRDTDVQAVEYGTGIKLSSNSSIITGFKGNMFKIDDGQTDNIYTSVFYDNVKYGSVSMTSGYFQGADVLTTNAKDVEHQKFNITASNNELILTANGNTTPVTLTIPEGEYTASEMADKLNDLFIANNLDLNATVHNGSSFDGLKISSTIKGATSYVSMSPAGSAYETLFVKRSYNNYTTSASYYRETKNDILASFTGSKVLLGANVPLTITTGSNDSFLLDIGDTNPYTITLNAGTYNDAEAIRAAIDDKLNGSSALSGYKGKINVTLNSGKICLTANNVNDFNKITVKANGANQGYDNIFLGKNVTYTTATESATGTQTTKPTITLNTPISNPASIPAGNNSLTITSNGTSQKVTLPTGDNVTHNDIITAINQQYKEVTTITPNTFTTIHAVGLTNNNNVNSYGKGNTKTTATNYTATGNSKPLQGQAGSYEYNTPAKVTLNSPLPNSLTLNDSNNKLKITINGVEKELTLTNGTYTPATLSKELQKKIDEAFTFYAGGAKVSLDASNKLSITARLNRANGSQINAVNTNISFSTSGSSLINELHTTRTAGTATTPALSSNSINITDADNKFSFTYEENGVPSTVELTLSNGTYTREGLKNEINRQLNLQNIPVTAKLNSNNTLSLTTKNAGIEYAIRYNSSFAGTAVKNLYGDLITHTAAASVAGRDTLDTISIDNQTDVFNVTVNGVPYSITLDHGNYNRTNFIDMLSRRLLEENVPLKAMPDNSGERIKFETTTKGSSSTIYLSHASGGSSMKAIYGETTTTKAGVTATFTSDGKLQLTGTQNGQKLSVSSSTGSIFQTQKRQETPITPTSATAYIARSSYVDGVTLSSPVTIDKWNDELNFTYVDNGTERNVSITLNNNGSSKDYTYSELQQALSEAIDNTLGMNTLKVTVNSGGVRIETVKTGSNYYLKNNFSGDFYNKVMCKATEINDTRSTTVKNGTGPKDVAYTIGRKDVKTTPVTIKTGLNDTLNLDLTYGGTTKKLSLTLNAGTYQGKSLTNMLQKKMNEELVNLGLPENMIEVGIGGITTSIVGSNDANALNFKLSDSVPLPAEGLYIIDGVSGNAAFSVFYQTDGILKEAYAKGSKDLSDGVVIKNGKGDLTFDVDGTTYALSIPPDNYTPDKLLAEMNKQLKNISAPVGVELEDGKLKIAYSKLGEHTINNIGGSAKSTLFYTTNQRISDENPVNIQFSSIQDDNLLIDRPILNTVTLGINSIAITRPKYAKKALDRLDEALNLVSDVRSMFGAMQNRLEHSLRNNENKAENLQSAESRIRDLDMEKELVQHSLHNIISQASQAMIAQANANAENVTRLLDM